MLGNELRALKALVVDDDINVCLTVEFILDTQGIKSTCVASVQEALEVYMFLKPNVLISNINLPGENGLSLIRHIRALRPEDGGHVPAIVITGYAFEDVGLKAIEAGFQRFIAKPFNVDELLIAVIKLLEP